MIENPDKKGVSKIRATTKVYVQIKNKNRNFLSKYLLVFVNAENGFVESARFDRNLKSVKFKQ